MWFLVQKTLQKTDDAQSDALKTSYLLIARVIHLLDSFLFAHYCNVYKILCKTIFHMDFLVWHSFPSIFMCKKSTPQVIGDNDSMMKIIVDDNKSTWIK